MTGIDSGRSSAARADATNRRLFIAGCVALVATAMSFAIRGDIMGDFERLFALNKTDVGWIAGAAFWGFGLSILLGGPLCDLLGMGTLLRLAAAGHIIGTIATIAAPNFAILFAATLVIASRTASSKPPSIRWSRRSTPTTRRGGSSRCTRGFRAESSSAVF